MSIQVVKVRGRKADAALLLERLQSLHDGGVVGLDEPWPQEHYAGLFLLDEEEAECECECEGNFQVSAADWFEAAKAEPEFEALRRQWAEGERRHLECRDSLFHGENRVLLPRLLTFIRDLEEYRNSESVQQRLEYHLPTATALFASDLYFPRQPHDCDTLNSFVSRSGRSVLEVMRAQYGLRSPNLEGVCTAHTLAPLLKTLFTTPPDSFRTHEFQSFYASFSKSAKARMGSLNKPDFVNCLQQQQRGPKAKNSNETTTSSSSSRKVDAPVNDKKQPRPRKKAAQQRRA